MDRGQQVTTRRHGFTTSSDFPSTGRARPLDNHEKAMLAS
jgi:hypothetical protein